MYPGTFAATTPDKPAVIMGGSREVITYREPVSYTHLDVYKRQPSDSGTALANDATRNSLRRVQLRG